MIEMEPCKKEPYETKLAAKLGAAYWMVNSPDKHPSRMGVYHCTRCHKWHVTSIMTLASVGLFLKRFFLGVLTMVILILVNLVSLLFLPEILRAVVVAAIWIFIIYCVGHAVVDMGD